MTRPYPQISPFTVARGEAGINTSVPVAGINFKGALVKLTADETLTTSTAIPWDEQVDDDGNWWSPDSATLFVTPANVAKLSFKMGALLTPAVANMQFYMLKNGGRVDGAGYSQTDSGNVGFTWTSANLDTVEGDLWEMIPEFAAGAPVLDADEVGGTWLSIEAKTAIAPSTATRGARLALVSDDSDDYSSGKTIPFDLEQKDTDAFINTSSAGVFRVPNSGITEVKVRVQAGMSAVAANATSVLKIWMNGATFSPVQIETRFEMANTGPCEVAESWVIEVASGDWFEANLLNTDGAGITVDNDRSWFEIEVINTSYLANVDSYHGNYFQGVPVQASVTYREKAPFVYTIPSSLTGSTAVVGIAPNSEETWSFQKNDVEFAQATISLSGDVTFASSLEQEFGIGVEGHILTFVAPDSGSAGDISFLLKGLG